jgi:2-alkyl-3-oxoalkanoate reductase
MQAQVAVTGASGFLGGAILRAALDSGHRVIALVRRDCTAEAGWPQHPALITRQVVFDDSESLRAALAGCDVVIHAAAALHGSAAEQRAGTVTATEQLLAAMDSAGITRLVAISSFSVYDYSALPEHDVLDEQAPLESHPAQRGIYARCKLRQETLCRAFGARRGCSTIVLRPGLIFDAQRLWGFFLGRPIGPFGWLALGPREGLLPLVHVNDVARAAVLALNSTAPGTQVFNVVDDAPVTRVALLTALRAVTPCRVLWFPWGLHQRLARAIATWWPRWLGGLPGLLDPVELAVRFKPLRYCNQAIRERLGWTPTLHALDAPPQRPQDLPR